MRLSHIDTRLVAYEAELYERNGRQVPARVREAFRAVRRDRFVSEWFERGPEGRFQRRSIETGSGSDDAALADVYSDRPLVTAVSAAGTASSSSSQPSLMMMMLMHLDATPGMKVLEIGTGTGYNAALLAHIVGAEGSVVTVEVDQGLADRAAANLRSDGVRTATVLAGDGSRGLPKFGPYDRIIVTVGAQTVHDEWVAQLAEGGRIVLPLDHSGNHVLTVLGRTGASETLVGYFAGWSSFVAGLAGLRLGPRVSTCRLADEQRLAPVAPLPAADAFPDFSFFAGLEHAGLTTIRVVGADGELIRVGPGIVDPDGEIAALAPGSLRATTVGVLTDLVRAALDRWESLGRPRLGDYEITLESSAAARSEEPAQWTRPVGARTEVVKLRRPAPPNDVGNG